MTFIKTLISTKYYFKWELSVHAKLTYIFNLD